MGRPSDATDELEAVLMEWGVEGLGEIAPTVISEVRSARFLLRTTDDEGI